MAVLIALEIKRHKLPHFKALRLSIDHESGHGKGSTFEQSNTVFYFINCPYGGFKSWQLYLSKMKRIKCPSRVGHLTTKIQLKKSQSKIKNSVWEM